jgi:hypothetical protein
MEDWVEDGRDYDAIEEELAGVLTPFIHLGRLNFDSTERRRITDIFPTREFLSVLVSFPWRGKFGASMWLGMMEAVEGLDTDSEHGFTHASRVERNGGTDEFDKLELHRKRFGYTTTMHESVWLFGFLREDKLTRDGWHAFSEKMEEEYNRGQSRSCFHAVHYRLREDEGPPTTTVMASVGPCISDGRAVCTCHHLEWRPELINSTIRRNPAHEGE